MMLVSTRQTTTEHIVTLVGRQLATATEMMLLITATRKEVKEMLSDLIAALITAKTEEELETAYKNLEKVGVDRYTALLLAREMLDE